MANLCEDSVMEVELSPVQSAQSTPVSAKRTRTRKSQPGVSSESARIKELKETNKKQRAEILAMQARLKKRRTNPDSVSDDEGESESEIPLMLEEEYSLRDDGQSVVDLRLRNRLRTPNIAPEKYWNRSNGSADIRVVLPLRGSSMYLSHLLPGRISSITLRWLHNSSKRLYSKHFLSKNASVEYDDDCKELGVRATRRGAVTNLTLKWEEASNLWELIEGELLNLLEYLQCFVQVFRITRPQSS